MSVEVSSSSDENPSLCSALFVFCSLACRLRVLDPPTNTEADIYNPRLFTLNISYARKIHNLLISKVEKPSNVGIQVKNSSKQHTAELLFLLSSSDASALGTLHDRDQRCPD